MAERTPALQPGYKSTELGPLPEEWEVVRLGELFEIQQGKAVSKKHRMGKSPRPFLRTANVLWGHLDLTTLDEMDFSESEMERLSLSPNDLLVCEGGDVGRTAIWRGELEQCSYQNHLHRLRTERADVEPHFYVYWMQAAILLLNLYGGAGNKTTIPNLSRSRLGALEVPLPPLPEQRAIAHVLHIVQRVREATEKVIAATRELKKSLMGHLFTYGPVSVEEAGQVPLKETGIGAVPEHWEVVSLGEVVTQTQYGLSQRGQADGEYPILRMNNLYGGQVAFADRQYVDLDDKTLAKFRLCKGDLLFNRTNSYELVGKTALFELSGDYVFASYLIRVVTDTDRLTPNFLNYYLNAASTQARLKLLASRGVSQSNISATKLKGFSIPLPPLPEQREIADVLSAVDAKISAEENRKRSLETLFKTLLHHLMTGKLRVEAEASE